MIRAFAPGMTMQEPLPQSTGSFDVRNEPTESEPPPPSAESGSSSDELSRLEELLLVQARERRELAQELERRSTLLRDACSRLTELGPQVAAAASEHAVYSIRQERDSAVARAVEAEVARADAEFRVDELMGALAGAGREIPQSAISPSPKERALAARVAELDEQKAMAEARLLLLEDELAQERAHIADAARERVEAGERVELEIGQVRVWAETAQQKLAELTDARGALLGERDGTRSRLDEAERALRVAQEQLGLAQTRANELREKLEAVHSERAKTLTLADANVGELRAELERSRASGADLERTSVAQDIAIRDLRAALEAERARALESGNTLSVRDAMLEDLQAELESVRAESAQASGALHGHRAELVEARAEIERARTEQRPAVDPSVAESALVTELRAEVERLRSRGGDPSSTLNGTEATLFELRAELERDRSELRELRNVLAVRDARAADLELELQRAEAQTTAGAHGLAEVEATLAEVQAEIELKQVQIAASSKALAAQEAAFGELKAELERERAARSWMASQLAAAEASSTGGDPEAIRRRIETSQQEQVDTVRATLLELRSPLLELENELTRVASGEARLGGRPTRILIDSETLSAMDEQLRQKDTRIEELEAMLAAEKQARQSSPADREARAAARDVNVATLKGELIDVRQNATRLSDDLTKERTRRRKMAVTVRALQAATESGEAPGPWIEELMALINEGSFSLPPRS